MHHRHLYSSTPRTARRAVLHAALAVPLALGIAGHAAAQTAATAFPTKTIRFVVPYPPGGPTDLMARMLQPELQSRLGVTVVVDNKGGAGGNTGSAEVAKQAPADGHTLLLAASGPMAVNPSLYASMPFNPLTDLAPVIQLSAFPLVLEVHPSLGVKTFAEFLAMAKAGKPVLNYASAGNGTPQHLAGELFNTTAGVKMGHIPYRGAGPALNDLIGGQVNVMFDIVGSSLPHIQAGKLIPLAVTSTERAKVLPNVPTMAEAGIAGYQITGWHGIAVRAGTPQATIDKLNATVNAIFKEPAFRAKWEAIGTPAVGGTAADFGALIKADAQRLGKLVRDAGVTVD
ncbi:MULTISPECIES: tripartite tricarboxylate transporter substrate binding protein [Acidovorax]|uniref:Bug family tripartite tricarboxylate transporter substrate binding protein n=1 Tax=Acidovorax facilis TaxID=12917 RepID=A0ABV8DFN5_9BURK|nr:MULTISPECIES: tripartite tricarboxylate transporter substrate binding protein [Acidovorax]KQB61254.1 MFS transporter [Acidovorax sp. SD340]MBO1008465.1 tripartite tricarboxylate transporter substrate binding protein [Acidovorax sp. SD340]MCO4241154.1 tripartite tricarboxylate transporter substrate binding protein [Acidovorax facilis]